MDKTIRFRIQFEDRYDGYDSCRVRLFYNNNLRTLINDEQNSEDKTYLLRTIKQVCDEICLTHQGVDNIIRYTLEAGCTPEFYGTLPEWVWHTCQPIQLTSLFISINPWLANPIQFKLPE